MKIIVTGGAGMIGTNLVTALVKLNHNVTVIDNYWRGTRANLEEALQSDTAKIRLVEADLAEAGNWSEEFHSADVVVHLADVVAGVGYVFANEGTIFRKNLKINANVTEAIEQYPPKRYIYVGTACSFPKEIQTGVDAAPMREEQQFPASPESGYGWSKLMGEIDAHYIEKELGIPTVTLVLHNVYGTPTEFRGNRAQAIPAMLYRALTEQQYFDVWGSGRQGRAFVHVTDVVNALILALDRGHGCGPIQIGPDVCTSIKEIAETIMKITPRSLEIRYDLTKPEGDRGRCADYSKATRVLGWRPSVELQDGLVNVMNWIKTRL
jgi:GDP-D-mannose 3',5'-epimerase